MILILFAQLTHVNVLHWIVGLYYYAFLVNRGIGLILVIQTFYPSTLSVLYNKDVYLLLYDLLLFLLLYLNHIRLQKTLSYRSHTLYYFTLLTLWFIYLCTFLCVYILLLSCFGCSLYSILLNIIPSSFYTNHTTYS